MTANSGIFSNDLESYGVLKVSGNTTLNSNLQVLGNTTLNNLNSTSITNSSNITVGDSLYVTSNIHT